MGYGKEALRILQRYYEGEIQSLSEEMEEPNATTVEEEVPHCSLVIMGTVREPHSLVLPRNMFL